MRYSFVIATTLFSSIALATPSAVAQTVHAPSANELAQMRAAQIRANQPFSKLSTTLAKPYTLLSKSGPAQKPALLWIHAPTVNSQAERAHTLMKAAEDFYNETQLTPIFVHMATLPQHATYMHQAIGMYDAEKRTWRVMALKGEAIPAWKIQVTEDWYDLIDNNGKLTIDEQEAKHRIGRLRNISASHIEPLAPPNLEPYTP